MSSAHVENAGHTSGYEAQRLHTHDMEIGVTDAVQRHVTRHVVAPKPISQRKLDFEHARPRWLREMAAEAIGVFFYVYPGIASQASFFLNNTEPAFGSIFQIGWAYAIGIAFAISKHETPLLLLADHVFERFSKFHSLAEDSAFLLLEDRC